MWRWVDILNRYRHFGYRFYGHIDVVMVTNKISVISQYFVIILAYLFRSFNVNLKANNYE